VAWASVPTCPRVRVSIAGAGLVTPLGESAAQTWKAILAGQSITDHAVVQKQWGGRSRVAGLAIEAARDAIADARWAENDLQAAALIIGTSKGPIIDWIENSSCGYGVSALATEVAAELRIQGAPRLTLSAACASGLHALIRGAMMIRAREATRVLVVAAEASVHDLFLSSFKRLGVLAKPGQPCRPFDESRSGFLMSEAGAAVCLEAVEGDDACDDILLENFALGADSTHLIAGDEHSVTLKAMLNDVIDARPIDLIHAHGTGTIANDPAELAAIESSVATAGGPKPSLYSHKAALGHSLGASGLVSVVLNRLAHQHEMVPPSLAANPIPTSRLKILPTAHARSINRSLAIASGFGGAIGVVSLISD